MKIIIVLECEDDPEEELVIQTSLLNKEKCYLMFGTKKEPEQFYIYCDIQQLKEAINKL